MTTVAATEFARNFTAMREAAQHAPVAVTAHRRVAGYFLSARDYADYQKLKAWRGEALYVHELGEEDIQALASARMDPRHDHLNALLD